MNIQRGTRDKLDKYVDLNQNVEVLMNVAGSSVYDYSCFGVDEAGKLSDDRYMVFYNQVQSPNGEVVYSADGQGAKFVLKLAQLPTSINKLVFTVSIDGNGTMGDITSHVVSIGQNGQQLIELRMSGNDFHSEKAIIAIEIYKKDVWRFAAVANGFNGGLGDLLRFYGGEEMEAQPQPQPQPQPKPQPQLSSPPQNIPQKVELRKGEKVNLRKNSNASLGEILINLNWQQPVAKGGIFGLQSRAIDLDLGCLYELKNGQKECVQALGKAFGSLNNPPFIALDGDDRSGASAGGENLRVNGAMLAQIKRILIYTFIYKGAAKWAEAQGVVSVKCPGSQEIIVRMDEYGSNLPMCAIALLENYNNETFSVEKVIRFFKNHKPMDEAFHWGLKWVAGRK